MIEPTMVAKSPLSQTIAAVAGAMSAFELGASMLASNGPSCSFVLLNALRIPSTFSEYMDNSMIKRSNEPLWIDDFVVDHEVDYFCKDTGFRWALPLVIYILSIAVLYQRFRGNRAQEAIIGFHLLVGSLVGVVAGFDITDILTGLLPATAWIAMTSMPLYIEENWKDKRGTLRFE